MASSTSAGLEEVLTALRQAHCPDSQVQQHVMSTVQALLESQQCAVYLTSIFAVMTQEDAEVRQRAGILLKNHISKQSKTATNTENANPAAVDGGSSIGNISPEAVAYIKRHVLTCLYDSNKVIRDTAGTIMSTVITTEGVNRWPEALPFLVDAIKSPQLDILESAFNTLEKIVEDSLALGLAAAPPQLAEDDPSCLSISPFAEFCRDSLLPQIFEIVQSHTLQPPTTTTTIVQKHCLLTLNQFALNFTFAPGEPLEGHFVQYFRVLGMLSSSTAPTLRQVVVAGMLSVLDFNEAAIICSAEDVFGFMVECCADEDYKVRLDSLEFWPTALKLPNAQAIVKKLLPRFLPCLLDNTRYTNWDYMQMDMQLTDDNSLEPDDSRDINPRFHTPTDVCTEDEEAHDSSKVLWGSGWTVRKAAALALDLLSNAYAEDILPHVLPIVEARLSHEEWELRESAVLTLGAISQGCLTAMSPYLPNVLQFLLGLCDDQKPLIRSISAWCVCRYSRWVCLPENRDRCLPPLLFKILGLALDKNKRVQEAATSAFAAIEEEARSLLVPFLGDIIDTLAAAFSLYQAKNLLVLYDAVGTLAECVGYRLNTANMSKLMEKLFERWRKTEDADFGLIALFECLSCLASAMQDGFVHYAKPVIERCVYILNQYFVQMKLREEGRMNELNTRQEISRELVDTTLDLLSAIVEALDAKITACFSVAELNFIPYIAQCLTDSLLQFNSSTSVSAFALVGRLSKHCVEYLKPTLPLIIPQLTRNLVHGSSSVCNNAAWALGELAIKAGGDVIEPFADDIIQRLSKVVQTQTRLKSLLQNACFTISRVGLVCPTKCSNYLSHFLRPWCFIMVRTPNESEKLLALRGLCVMIHKNQVGILGNVSPLLDVFASFYAPPPAAPNGIHNQIPAPVTASPPTPSQPSPTAGDVTSSTPLPVDSSDGKQTSVCNNSNEPSEEIVEMLRLLISWFQASFPEDWATTWASLSLETKHIITGRVVPLTGNV